MNDKDFTDAVFYNSDGIHWIKRYYTIEELYDINNDEIRDKYRLEICNYLKSINVNLYITNICASDFLKSIGVIIDNKELTIYELCFPKNCNIDKLEKNIIEYAKNFKCNIKPLISHIDVGTLNTLYFNGQLDLSGNGQKLTPTNESVSNPKEIDDISTFMINTLKILCSKGNTVVVTDDYLFKPKNDLQYEGNLNKILKSLLANKIIHYGRKDNINNKLFNKVKENLKDIGTTLIHEDRDDCHDRFWITEETKKGIVMGTSLNGICKKLFFYNELDNYDVIDILNYLYR